MQKKMNMYSLNTEICHHHLKQLNCPTEWIILTHLTAVNTCISCGYYIWKKNNPNYALLYDNLTFTLSSGCLTTLSERNLVGMKPMTPLSRRVLTPIACPGQEPLSKWFQTWAWKRKKKKCSSCSSLCRIINYYSWAVVLKVVPQGPADGPCSCFLDQVVQPRDPHKYSLPWGLLWEPVCLGNLRGRITHSSDRNSRFGMFKGPSRYLTVSHYTKWSRLYIMSCFGQQCTFFLNNPLYIIEISHD